MIKQIYLLVLLSIVFIITGCTASGIKYSTEVELENLDENLFIYRTNTFLGTAIHPAVYVDNKYLGTVEGAGFVKHTVMPGEHKLKVGNLETKFIVEKNEKYYFKHYVRISLFYFITLSPEELTKIDKRIALKELTETRLSNHRIDN